MLDLTTAGGDGATLTIRPRRLRVFKAFSVLFHGPGGQVAEVEVLLMTRRRWHRAWAGARPDLKVLPCGPIVMAVGLRL